MVQIDFINFFFSRKSHSIFHNFLPHVKTFLYQSDIPFSTSFDPFSTPLKVLSLEISFFNLEQYFIFWTSLTETKLYKVLQKKITFFNTSLNFSNTQILMPKDFGTYLHALMLYVATCRSQERKKNDPLLLMKSFHQKICTFPCTEFFRELVKAQNFVA